MGARVECILSDPPDWESFYDRCGEDEPIEQIVSLVRVLQEDPAFKIILCSGRIESCRNVTQAWMDDHSIYPEEILLRKNNDNRHDIIVKPEMLLDAGISTEQIAFVIEDRNSMVKKWREMGLVCLQPAEGDF